MVTWGLAGLVASLVGLLATRAVIPPLAGRGIVDMPNSRSSHTRPTPRGGGLGLLAGVAAGALVAAVLGATLPGAGYWIGALLISSVGWLDDTWPGGVSVVLRLVAQVTAALVVVIGVGGLSTLPLPAPADVPLGAWGLPVAVLWVVAVTNFYNFLDGIDGYAAAQGILAGLVLLLLAGAQPVLGLGGVIAGGCLGFAVFNWHRARVFMGDVGSGTLGFLFAALPFHAGPVEAPGLVVLLALALWFFLADGAFTLAGRALRRERIWAAHRSHVYQRLARTGLRHDQVVLRILCLAAVVAAAGGVAWAGGAAGLVWMALLIGLGAFLALIRYTRDRERRSATLPPDIRPQPTTVEPLRRSLTPTE